MENYNLNKFIQPSFRKHLKRHFKKILMIKMNIETRFEKNFKFQ